MDTGGQRQCSDSGSSLKENKTAASRGGRGKGGNNQGFFGVAPGVAPVAGGRAAVAGLFAGAAAPELFGAGAAEGLAAL